MSSILDWVQQNQILSGTATVFLAALGFIAKRLLFKPADPPAVQNAGSQNAITINNTNIQGGAPPNAAAATNGRSRSNVRVLFVDDDRNFKVVRIMKQAGWPNVDIKKDIKDLDGQDVRDADVLFIDINGVGIALGFADGGLGLSLAIKKKYPEKKVVIYSAQTDGDRFHTALKRADGSLAKNADPYEFISLLEELTGI